MNERGSGGGRWAGKDLCSWALADLGLAVVAVLLSLSEFRRLNNTIIAAARRSGL